MSSMPTEPYYPPELLGDPVLLDWITLKDLLWRLVKATVGTLRTIAFWLFIVQLDVLTYIANLFLPRRSPQSYHVAPGRAPSAWAGGSRVRRLRQISRRRAYVAARGDETVPHSFSPLFPPPFLQAPLVFLICQLAFFFGAIDGRAAQWLRWWSTWCGVGYRGDWGSAEWPGEWDCRGPCPALNALANHGILPFNGSNVSPHQAAANVARSFNLSPSLTLAITWAAEPLWRDRGTFSLDDLCAHNLTEQDASLLRPDANSAEGKEDDRAQARSWPSLVDALLPTTESEKVRAAQSNDPIDQDQGADPAVAEPYSDSPLSLANLGQAIATRRVQCAATNGQFSLNLRQKLYSSFKIALLRRVFGGNIGDLRCIVGGTSYTSIMRNDPDDQYLSGLEHLPAGWQPVSKACFGLTLIEALWQGMLVELTVGATDLPRTVTADEGQAGWLQPSEVETITEQPSIETRTTGIVEERPGKPIRVSPAVVAQRVYDDVPFPESEDTLEGPATAPSSSSRATGEPKLKNVTFSVAEKGSEQKEQLESMTPDQGVLETWE